MILAVLQGEGALCNRCYQQGKTLWPIHPKAAQPHTKGEAAFTDLKGEITRTTRLTKVRASWISHETWRLVNRRAALQRAHWSIAREVRQARQSFQTSLWGDRQRQAREAGEAIEAFLASDQKQEAYKRITSWYRKASGGQAPLLREHLDIIMTERADLYRCRTTEGIHIPILVTRAEVEYGVPEEV